MIINIMIDIDHFHLYHLSLMASLPRFCPFGLEDLVSTSARGFLLPLKKKKKKKEKKEQNTALKHLIRNTSPVLKIWWREGWSDRW
jgi:hypothetical protein